MSEASPRVVSCNRTHIRGRYNASFSVVENVIEFEAGKRSTQYAVHTPQVSLIVPVLEDGRLVLIRQFRHAVGSVVLEFPAGKIDKHETPEICAARELLEETGYKGNLTRVATLYASPEFSDETIHVFRATKLEYVSPQPELYERIEVFQYALRELALLFANPVTPVDAKSVAAFYTCQLQELID